MYIPEFNRVEDQAVAVAFMRANPFTILVSNHEDTPFATHLPVIVAEASGQIIVRAHVAKSNPHWRMLEQKDSLLIFHGPHAYVSPALYEIRESAPLAGVRILVGRARQQASALSAQLGALGADVIEIPFIEIRPPRSYKPLDTALEHVSEYQWLILTSVNGVEGLGTRMKELNIESKKLSHLNIATIGPSTRSATEKMGLKVSVVPAKYVAESVVESLRERVQGQRVLLVRAAAARDVIPRELRKMGGTVDVVEAYETVVPGSSKTKVQSLMKDP